MRGAHGRKSGARGSVLVPMVAALLIMLLAGIALAEVLGAQRMQSVIDVQSKRAYWIAEAGLWHAAHAQASIVSAVPFGDGSYLVDKDGTEYDATGTLSPASRRSARTFTGGGSQVTLESPIDESASAATAEEDGSKTFSIELVSLVSHQAEIASFELSSDQSVPALKKLKLDGDEIWRQSSGVSLPTGERDCNRGDSGDRTIDGLDDPTLQAEHKSSVSSGTVDYTLVLHFVDSASSTLNFSIEW